MGTSTVFAAALPTVVRGFLCFFLSVLTPIHAQTAGGNADPTSALKELQARVERDAAILRVFREGDSWVKTCSSPKHIEYDIQKTNSIVSPVVATVKWDEDKYDAPKCATRREADAAQLPHQPTQKATGKNLYFWAKLAWQNGKWEVQDVGVRIADLDYRVSDGSKSSKRTLYGEWRAFGGTVDEDAEAALKEGGAASQYVRIDNRTESGSISNEESRRDEKVKAAEKRLAAAEGAEWRTWIEASGKHSIHAKFGGMIDGKVNLIKDDGATIKVPLDKLSKEDQESVKNRKR